MAKVYVGTYKKYNGGSIAGGWLDLASYKTYDEFLRACKSLHKDERDPEFMIQDTEDFPDGLKCLEWLSREDFDDVKSAMKEDYEQETPSISIIDYSDKAFAVVGDTRSVKDDLKRLGGRFNGKLSCGAGWIFSNKVREAVEKFISSGEVKRMSNTPSEGRQFVDWLNEVDETYYKKCSVGAIKIQGGYYLIEKPSIENQFWFHDEGPDYEYYKEVVNDEKSKQEYFKAENLATFDNKIERITKGDFGDKRVWWNACYKNNRVELCFHSSFGHPDGYTECSDEEKALILKGLQFGRKMYEKRLDSYLKRWGTSKLHFGTYWADR